jgi:Arylsulfotransferase (ASST)
MAVFDNGDYRVVDDSGDVCNPSGQPACYSTAAIFDVNENTRTASRLWSNQTPYSNWGGSTQELSNSNVFFDETAPADLDGGSSRILEVTQQPNPVTLWELQFNDLGSYRALHLGSLYPGVQW